MNKTTLLLTFLAGTAAALVSPVQGEGPVEPTAGEKLLANIRLETKSIPQLGFIDEGRGLAALERTGGRLVVWRREDWSVDGSTPLDGSPISLTFSPDNRWLAVVKSGGLAELYSLGTAGEIAASPSLSWRVEREGPYVPITSRAAFSPDGKRMALGFRIAGRESTGSRYAVQVFTLDPPAPAFSFRPAEGTEMREPEVYALEFSPDGLQLAVGDRDGWLRLFSAEDGRLIRAFGIPSLAGRAHFGFVGFARFSPDGRLLASGDARSESVVRVWETETGKRIGELKMTARGVDQIQGMDFSPDGRTLAVSSLFKAGLYEAPTLQELWAIEKQDGEGGFSSAVFSPSGDAFAFVDYAKHFRREKAVTIQVRKP